MTCSRKQRLLVRPRKQGVLGEGKLMVPTCGLPFPLKLSARFLSGVLFGLFALTESAVPWRE